MRRELERIEIPGEHDARERTWAVVRAAHTAREPIARPVRLAPLLAAAAVAVVVAAALTPPGRAVVDRVREVIGVEDADEGLFSLPANGRLLVNSASGAWIVHDDGSKRRLGAFRQASWSPRGLFVVATGIGEQGTRDLVALNPKATDDVRWKLSRPVHLRFPRWAPSGFRIAYLAGDTLRVVAGDGTGDRLLARGVAAVAPAWKPGRAHVVAYVSAEDSVVVRNVDSGRTLWSSRGPSAIRALVWAPDGRRLLVLGRREYRILADGRTLRTRATPVVAAAWGPQLALVRRAGTRSELLVAGRRVFSGTGSFRDVEWSPDGKWLIVAWREPDQWLFVARSGERVRGVADVTEQFDSSSFPDFEGWCCP